MRKSYADIAMEVIRADWYARRATERMKFSYPKIARAMCVTEPGFNMSMNPLRRYDPTVDWIARYCAAVGIDIRDVLSEIGNQIYREQQAALTALNNQRKPYGS